MDLGLGEHVPKPELDSQAAVGLQLRRAADQGLCIDQPPVPELGCDPQCLGILDESAAFDRAEQTAAFQVGRDHTGDILAVAQFLRQVAMEIGYRDWKRLDEPTRDIDNQLGVRRNGETKRQDQEDGRTADQLQGHVPNISRGLNRSVSSRQMSYFLIGSLNGLQMSIARLAFSAALRK